MLSPTNGLLSLMCSTSCKVELYTEHVNRSSIQLLMDHQSRWCSGLGDHTTASVVQLFSVVQQCCVQVMDWRKGCRQLDQGEVMILELLAMEWGEGDD